MEKKILEISWISLWRILFFLIFVLLLFLGRQILLGLFLAIVISSGFDFLIDFLEKKGLPRTLGVITVFLLSAAIIVIVLYAVVPLIIVDLNSTLIGIQKLGEGSFLKSFINFNTTKSLETFINQLSARFLSGDSSPLGAFSAVVGGVILGISILVSAFYLSLSRDGVERFIRAVLPNEYEESLLKIYSRARKKIGSWFRMQIFLSTTMAALVWLALFILGVKHAFLLGILAGIFELVPFVGPILSGAAAVVSAFVSSPALALYTLIVFVFIHQIENHLLVPIFTGRSVDLHPVIVIIALLIGIEAGGVLGALISIPAVVVIQEVLEEWADRGKRRAVGKTALA
jgi:predicted PurR-regulated permease PerM